MARVSFEMSDIQCKEWFIVALLTHIRLPLMQQNIVTHNKALQISMKLDASHVGENAVEMSQIQMQLPNLTLRLQDIKKGKEQHEDIWYTRCCADGHNKDAFSDL